MGTEPPIFVVGPPRSGTSLLTMALGMHPRIGVCMETHFYPALAPVRDAYGDLADERALSALVDDVRKAVAAHPYARPVPAADAILRMVSRPTLSGVFEAYLDAVAAEIGKPRVVEKTPDHHRHLDRIMAAFPDSPILFAMRDPRDVVASMRDAFGWSPARGVHEWLAAWESLRAHADRVRLVRYEALVSEPEPTLRAVCAWIGEPFDAAMLDPHRHPRLRGADVPRGHERILEPIDDRSVGRFRRLPPKTVARVEATCREGMEGLGYPLETAGTARPYGPEGRLRRILGRVRFYATHPGRLGTGLTWFGIPLRGALRRALRRLSR